MEQITLERRGRSDGTALVGLSVLTFAVTLLAYSPAEVPLIDDWTYAWSVEHFLQTGALRVLEWSSHYPLAQILWGSLFSQLLGFSFAVLRLSTLVLAWAGLLALYGMLRELGARPLLAGRPAAVVQPRLLCVESSFTTDVPFVSVMNAALFGYALGQPRTYVGSGLGSVMAMPSSSSSPGPR
jgi:hypothetical protein